MRLLLEKSMAALILCTLTATPAALEAGEEEVYQADEITVTGTRTLRGTGESAGSIVVISREEIEAAATPDIKTILTQVPGLTINDSGVPAGVATASIRGSRSTQVLILLDGVRLANAQSSFFNLNDLPVPLELVERIEVLPMTASHLYGADALGGVINVITRPPEGKTRFAISQGVGSYSELRTAATLQAGTERLALRAAGQLRSGNGQRENSDYDMENISLDIGTTGGDLTFNFGLDYLAKDGGNPGHLEFPTPEARQEDEKSYLSLRGDYRPGDAWVLGGTIFYDRQRRDYVDPTFGEDSRHKNRKGGVDLQGSLETGKWGLWTAGGEWISDDVDSTDDGEHDTYRWGAYLQDEWEGGPWTVIGTIRLDDHSVYGSEASPRLMVLRSLAHQWRLWASGARAYRAPNFDDLYWTSGFGVGNPDLKPETSREFEAGAEKRWGSSGKVRLAVFQRDVDDLIQWTDPDGDFIYSPENIASARIRGLEADAEYAPLPWLVIPLGYQYLDPEDNDTGDKLDGQIKHLFQAAVRARSGGFHGGIEGYYADRYGTAATKDWNYTVLAATAGWNGAIGRFPFRASVRLDNLLDEDYETVEGFPMPGRNVFAEAGLSF